MKRNMNIALLILLLTVISSQTFAQITAQYINLGFGGAAKVSDNGVYVCGSNYPSPGFLWSEQTGRISLGNTYSEAFGVSNDGKVGGSFIDSTLLAPNGNPTLRAGYYNGYRWVALEGYPGYPVLDEMTYNNGDGISADGSIVVGMQWTPNWKAEACYWDSTGIIHMLGRTGGSSSRANDVATTSTGFVIAGWDGLLNGPGRRAFYWDPQPHFMGGLDSTYPDGQCYGLNSDGSKIVGGSLGAPFVWSQEDGMKWLSMSYLSTGSYAKDISDNDIIVGHVDVGGFNYQAFIKRPEWSTLLLLQDYLIDSLGMTEVSDWLNSFAHSISADGLTIAGTAYPVSGGPIAYVIKFTDPLPVELTSFTGSGVNGNVELNWITNSELNNQGFVVERKTENSDWSSIGFVSGYNTTTETHNYQFTDNEITAYKYFYRLKQIDFDGTFEYSNIIEVEINSVSEFTLNQNYPNPFNPTTNISFTLPQSSAVKLSVFNMLGEKVVDLIDEVKSSGSYEINFDGTGLTSGIYLYKLEAGDFISIRKMTLLK